MYEISRTSQLSVMLGLDSFADMLTYNENLTRISESDDRLVKNLQQEKALMEQQAADIQTALDDLNAQKEEMENLNAQYAAAIQKAASDALAAQQQAEAYTQYSEAETVSYTHLDVYKRQVWRGRERAAAHGHRRFAPGRGPGPRRFPGTERRRSGQDPLWAERTGKGLKDLLLSRFIQKFHTVFLYDNRDFSSLFPYYTINGQKNCGNMLQ